MSKFSSPLYIVELLVDVFIISILLSMIIVSMSQSRKDARNARRTTDLKQVMTAMELYYGDNEKYIVSSDNLCNDDSIGKAMPSVPEDSLSSSAM